MTSYERASEAHRLAARVRRECRSDMEAYNMTTVMEALIDRVEELNSYVTDHLSAVALGGVIDNLTASIRLLEGGIRDE